MGGGKETPRQKMIGMMYLVLTALLAMNISKQVLKGYISVNDSMEQSKKNLEVNNRRISEAFAASVGANPAAKPYQEQSIIAQKTIAETIKYISDLKAEIIMKTEGYNTKGEADTARLKYMEKMSDYDMASHILIGSEAATPHSGPWSAKELRGKLDDLSKKLITQLDAMQKNPAQKFLPDDYNQLKKRLESIKPIDTGEKDNGITLTWETANFYHLPLAAIVTSLNKTQADLKNIEAEILNTFSAASGKLTIKFDRIIARVVAPSSYIQAGQPYEADIFLAASSSKLGQGDMEIMLGIDSAGAAAGGKGSELIPLVAGEGKMKKGTGGQGIQEYKGVIKYKNPDGTFKYYPFKGEYMVAAPAVAVSAEQMKVFYVGVTNPIMVSAAGISPTDLQVTASGGGARLSPKGGGKFDGVFTTPGECTISVSAKGKPQGTSKFKVKPLPKPELKLAGKFSPSTLTKAELQTLGGLGAGANGFEFQANFVVLSYEVTGKVKGKVMAPGEQQGNNLSGESATLVKGADKGSSLFIDAKVKGPDGRTNSVTQKVKVM